MNSKKRFDFLEIKGSYSDIGRAIGSKFGESIKKHIDWRRNNHKGYVELVKRSEPFYNITKETFPHLIEEMNATAQASGVTPMEYFSANNPEALHKVTDHCTVAVSFKDGEAIVGHNEDEEGLTPESLYLLKATVNGTTFFGLQYKNYVSGVSAAMNSWGLAQCINFLYNRSGSGVPKFILARAVLECKTLDEAEGLIKNTVKASGYNHVLVQGGEVRDIEVAQNKISVDRVIGKPYVHTNHYLSPKLSSFEKFHTESSIARYNKAEKLIKNKMTVQEMESLLSDNSDQKFPILRPDATLGSLVFNLRRGKAFIRYGADASDGFTEYNI